MPETARPRELGPSSHTHPAPLIWCARDNVGLLNPTQLLGRKRDAYPSPTRGQHKWGDAYPCPARVPITWYAYCFEMLAYWCLLPSFSIHSPLGHLAHKYKQNACIRHVIILFLHNIISQPWRKPYWRWRSQVSLWSIGRDVQPSMVKVSWPTHSYSVSDTQYS